MAKFGLYSIQDALNRALPIFRQVLFGDLLNQLITSVNGMANKMDQQGGLGARGTATATTGGTINAGDTYILTFLNPSVVALKSPGLVMTSQTIASNDTLITIASALANTINNNTILAANGISATASSSVTTISAMTGTIGNTLTATSSLSSGASATVTMGNSGVFAGGTGTFGGGNTAAYGSITPLSQRGNV